MDRNRLVPVPKQYAMTQMVPTIVAGLVEWQRGYNHLLSMQAEALMLAPKCAWVPARPLRPWYRLDLRIQDWMHGWDKRFAGRRAKWVCGGCGIRSDPPSGWGVYVCHNCGIKGVLPL